MPGSSSSALNPNPQTKLSGYVGHCCLFQYFPRVHSELSKDNALFLFPDIDECAEEGGKNGHHCLGKTKCVNTIGSYKCQCENGHDHTDDPYTCEGTSNLLTATPTVILICLCLILCQSLRTLHWM